MEPDRGRPRRLAAGSAPAIRRQDARLTGQPAAPDSRGGRSTANGKRDAAVSGRRYDFCSLHTLFAGSFAVPYGHAILRREG